MQIDGDAWMQIEPRVDVLTPTCLVISLTRLDESDQFARVSLAHNTSVIRFRPYYLRRYFGDNCRHLSMNIPLQARRLLYYKGLARRRRAREIWLSNDPILSVLSPDLSPWHSYAEDGIMKLTPQYPDDVYPQYKSNVVLLPVEKSSTRIASITLGFNFESSLVCIIRLNHAYLPELCHEMLPDDSDTRFDDCTSDDTCAFRARHTDFSRTFLVQSSAEGRSVGMISMMRREVLDGDSKGMLVWVVSLRLGGDPYWQRVNSKMQKFRKMIRWNYQE